MTIGEKRNIKRKSMTFITKTSITREIQGRRIGELMRSNEMLKNFGRGMTQLLMPSMRKCFKGDKKQEGNV